MLICGGFFAKLPEKAKTCSQGERVGVTAMLLNEYNRNLVSEMLMQAEVALSNNLMSFWTHNTWDIECGGFLTRLDRSGNRIDDSEKILMMQVRMISSLAAAHRYGLKDYGYLDLADRGFDYLIHNFWDEKDGGFFYSLNRDGTPKCRRKNTDFHGYAMTGLVEYYLASGKQEALEWADRVFDLLLDKAADRDMGYIEDFDDGDWPVLNAEQMQLSQQHGIKTIDMHANMLEGMMYLAGATDAEKHKNALSRLLDLICIMGIHLEHGCTITAFDADWRPVGDALGCMTTSYGLNVELAWFIWQAASVLKEENEMYHVTALRLVDHALKFGFDVQRGGLAAFGPVTGHVLKAEDLGEKRLLKSWWAQAELLNALCDACRRTGDLKYFNALVKTYDWIQKFQIDHEFGDWYQDTLWDTGEPATTDKGGEFKTAFHAGRALIRAINAFREWL